MGPLAHIPYHSKQIKDLNIRVKTIKFLEETTDTNPCGLGLGSGFSDMTLKLQKKLQRKSKQVEQN